MKLLILFILLFMSTLSQVEAAYSPFITSNAWYSLPSTAVIAASASPASKGLYSLAIPVAPSNAVTYRMYASTAAKATAVTVGAMGVKKTLVAVAGKAVPYVSVAITAYQVYDTVMQAAKDDPVTYPKLAAITVKSSAIALTDIEALKTGVVGSVFTSAGANYTMSVFEGNNCFYGPPNSILSYNYAGHYRLYAYTGGPGSCGGGDQNRYTGYTAMLTVGGVATALPLTASEFEQAIALNKTVYDAAADPVYMDELNKVFDDNVNVNKVATDLPSLAPSLQSALSAENAKQVGLAQAAASTAAQTAADLAQSIADLAQARSNADPANQQLADAAKAASLAASQSAATAAQVIAQEIKDQAAAQEAVADQEFNDLTSTPNVYDSTILSPEKKSISTLITDFIASSPIAALINSFSFNVSAGSCKEFFFTAYGVDNDFDLCPYTAQFNIMGGIILAFSHLTALFIVFRKGA